MSVTTRIKWLFDRLCSAPSAALVGLGLELEPEGTSAHCQIKRQKGRLFVPIITYHPMASPLHPLAIEAWVSRS